MTYDLLAFLAFLAVVAPTALIIAAIHFSFRPPERADWRYHAEKAMREVAGLGRGRRIGRHLKRAIKADPPLDACKRLGDALGYVWWGDMSDMPEHRALIMDNVASALKTP